MSVARPQNRAEFRQYVLTKLGAPVIEINVSEEQIDIAIEDAFQYFHERNHFDGVENVYLTFQMTQPFLDAFSSYRVQETNQSGKGDVPIPGRPTVVNPGQVAELTLVTPGKGYPSNAKPLTNQNATEINNEIEITTQDNLDITTELGEDIVYQTSGSGKGTGLTVNIGRQRTTTGGITNVSIYNVGKDYEVGDIVAINGATVQGEEALFEVTKIQTETPVMSTLPVMSQNNYLVLPDDVVGVNAVLRSVRSDLVGIFPGASVFPMLLGGMLGNDVACGDMGYDLVSYVAMREYMATLEFLFFPPIQYSFNQRTHKLYIDTNNFIRETGAYSSGARGQILALECMVKPSPDVYPDMWDDLWMKKYAVALVKTQWGRNLTKFQQVQLPGGITMNGDQILQQGREDLKELETRFSMDWADPPLDCVG